MITLKKGTLADYNVIATLISRLLEGFNERSGRNFNINKEFLEKSTVKLFKRNDCAAFIAFHESRIPVGLITITSAFSIYNGGEYGVITELFVDERYRSTGIGERLLEQAFTFSKSNNWKKIEVGAPNPNEWPRTISFYERNGFKLGGPKLTIQL